MRICHVTPHLPPDQAANALLPFHLGQWAVEAGNEPVYIAHTTRSSGVRDLPGPVKWIPRRSSAGVLRAIKIGSLVSAAAIVRQIAPVIESVDIAHVHSNGLLAEMAVLVARWKRKPIVLTLYGTEIWHYRPSRFGPDLFTRAYRLADHVTFYSRCLADRANELGLGRSNVTVAYPPVASHFVRADAEQQIAARAELGLGHQHVLLNVKRLHPLAGQRYLIEAMPGIVRRHPNTQLIFCGTGPLLDELQEVARRCGMQDTITFAGLVDNRSLHRYYAAADAFLLPSLLEAFPTVALEALACGTPVISSDNPGSLELHELFGDDVAVVPGRQPDAITRAVGALLDDKRRTTAATGQRLTRCFRPGAVAARYQAIYDGLVTS